MKEPLPDILGGFSVVKGTKFELYMAVSLATTNFSVNGQSSSNVSGCFY